jgi:hypothetical protein
VVFGTNCAAPVVRERSVMLTLIEVREFIMKRLLPAFAEELNMEFLLVEQPPALTATDAIRTVGRARQAARAPESAVRGAGLPR